MSINKRMFITDLDGTLFRSDHTFSQRDLKLLEKAGEEGITRVIATGRSLFSFQRSVKIQLPVDYIIFSTGAGISKYPAPVDNIIRKNALSSDETNRIIDVFESLGLDYTVHREIPENHIFRYSYGGNGNSDFLTRLNFYKGYCRPVSLTAKSYSPSSQLIAIVPQKLSVEVLSSVRNLLPGFSIIKTTSPFDGKTIWIEIFPKAVSKSQAASWLTSKLGISQENVISVGNDFNDEDLLDWSNSAYVVDNAPEELKTRFTVVSSNNESGVSDVLLKEYFSEN